jgi:hypothetical protein
MAQERSNAADLAAEACWVPCMVGIPQMGVLEVVLEVGIRLAASELHKEAAAAAVVEADMMIGGDASGIVVDDSVVVGTWKTQEAPHSLAWL